jgi:hypothetical protein
MEKKELKSHTVNADLLTEEQKRLFWAKKTIEKFKEYDKQRTEYVHRIEQDYQVLRKRYDELEAELYGSKDEPLKKGIERGQGRLQRTIESCEGSTHCRSCRRST